MKKNWMLFLFFAAFAALTFSGCSDDDNSDVPENTHLVSKEVQAAFNAKYPQAKDVILRINGKQVDNRTDMETEIRKSPEGNKFRIIFFRNQKENAVTM